MQCLCSHRVLRELSIECCIMFIVYRSSYRVHCRLYLVAWICYIVNCVSRIVYRRVSRIYCLLPIVYCVWCKEWIDSIVFNVVSCVLSIVFCLLSIVYCVLGIVNNLSVSLMCALCFVLYVVYWYCRLSMAYCLLSIVECLLSFVDCVSYVVHYFLSIV